MAVEWLWAPPVDGQVFGATREDCHLSFEKRRQFFQKWLRDDGAPEAERTHLSSSASFFHVAGTNGKGSVCAILEGCLSTLPNKSVGVFTSPHLYTFRERIRVNKQLMDEDRVLPLIEKAKALTADGVARSFNFFDKLLLLALLYFEEKKVDYVILETGLGGRWDPTNVINGSGLKVSIITSISMDHQEVLGDSLAQIAWEKAGIIKSGVSTVTMASQAAEVLEVLKQEAQLHGTSLHIVEKANEKAFDLLRQKLEGDIQKENVTLATAALHLWLLQSQEPEKAESLLAELMNGLPSVYHPCRFELFHLPLSRDGPNARSIPIVIDGAHNEDGLRKMLAYARQRFRDKQLFTVFGCGLYEKKFIGCLHAAHQLSDRIMLVASSHFKSAPVDLMRRTLEQAERLDRKLFFRKEEGALSAGEVTVSGGIKAALHSLEQEATQCGPDGAGSDSVIVVCGSLFVSAEGRAFLASLIPFPPHDWVHHADGRQPSAYK